MNIQKILEYQAKDAEIHKLEQQLKKHKDNEAIDKVKKLGKESQATSMSLESEAEATIAEYNKVKKAFDNAMKKLKTYTEVDVSTLSESACKEKVNQVNEISTLLNSLEKKTLALADKINLILGEFNKAKKQYLTARATHAKLKEKYKILSDELTPEIKKLSEELKSFEPDLNPKFLSRYKEIRKDVFPVLVPLKNNSCGRCGVELPYAQIEKIKNDGFLECENCHRIIYFMDN